MSILNAMQGIIHPFGLVHYQTANDYYFYWTEFTEGYIKRAGPVSLIDSDNANITANILRTDSVPLFELRLFDSHSHIGKYLYSNF